MWLDKCTILVHLFPSRDRAVGFLEAYLTGKFQLDEDHEPHIPEGRLTKRQRITPRLHCPDTDGFMLPEGAADVLSPSEIMDMKAQHLINLLCDTPFVASMRQPPPGL